LPFDRDKVLKLRIKNQHQIFPGTGNPGTNIHLSQWNFHQLPEGATAFIHTMQGWKERNYCVRDMLWNIILFRPHQCYPTLETKLVEGYISQDNLRTSDMKRLPRKDLLQE